MNPLTLTLPAVAQAVTFTKSGYRSVVKTIQPQGSSVQKVSVTLQGEYQARLQEAPREYTSHAGIKLSLAQKERAEISLAGDLEGDISLRHYSMPWMRHFF